MESSKAHCLGKHYSARFLSIPRKARQHLRAGAFFLLGKSFCEVHILIAGYFQYSNRCLPRALSGPLCFGDGATDIASGISLQDATLLVPNTEEWCAIFL